VNAKQVLAGALGLAAIVSPLQGSAAQQSTASASANAEVVGTTLNITPLNPLAFGRMKSDGPGTVVVTVAPQRLATGGVVLIGSGQCSTPPCDTTNQSNQNSASFWSPGMYTVSGIPNAAYRVTSATTATATLKSGSSAPTTLDVTGVNVATDSSNYTSNIGTLDANGQGTIRVGGTLQVTGVLNASSYYLYSVDVPVTVQYN
jgi:hypothetical protein